MSRLWLTGISAIGLVTLCAGRAPAADITTKKMSIKDAADTTKRQIQLLSADPAVMHSSAVDPATNGAAVHVYSATDDDCFVFPAGTDVWKDTGTKWQFKSKLTKNALQIKTAKLIVKLKTGVTYSLADNMTQGTVNAQVQVGAGTKFCMRCTGNKKDEMFKFQGAACAAAACDPEPSSCAPPIPTTTTTSTTTSSTTTTTLCTNVPTGTVVKGSLTATIGRFNYNLTVGLPGANAACTSNFPGSHPCTLSELQSAPTSDLQCLRDTSSIAVGSFWAIDPAADPVTAQCFDDVTFNPMTQPGHNWEYGTAHTLSRGQKVTLNNGTGVLGALQTGVQCNIAGTNWVGCCQ